MIKSFDIRLIILCICCYTCLSLNAQSRNEADLLDAGAYHQMKSGLQNSQIVFEQKQKGRVAFVGGSITQNGGWRDSVCAYLTERFPDTDFEFIQAGIASMGSTPAAFRLQRDVFSHGKIDLLFEEAAVNDAANGRSKLEQIRAMEGIMRQTRYHNPACDIVLMHFVDPDKMDTYRADKEPSVIRNHNAVAAHYNIPTINLAKEVTDRIDHGEFTWEDDFVNLHPSPFGQGIYARSIIRFLDNAYSLELSNTQKIAPHPLPRKLDSYCYDRGRLLDISTAIIINGWDNSPYWQPNDGKSTRPNYTEVPMLISQEPGSELKFQFYGNLVGIAIAAGPDAGIIKYRIDDKEWQVQDLYTKWSRQLHLPWYYTLASELEDKEHTLIIKMADTKNEESSGTACRIRYFYINGKK